MNFCICLFVWGFYSHSGIFHSYGDVTITDQGIQMFTYARHSWPLSSEGSLACPTYCDTGHPFIRTRDTHTCCPAFGSEDVIGLFLQIRSVAAGIRTPKLPLAGQML